MKAWQSKGRRMSRFNSHASSGVYKPSSLARPSRPWNRQVPSSNAPMGSFLGNLFVLLLLLTTASARSRSLSPLYGTNSGVAFSDLNSTSSFRALSAIRIFYGWVIDGIQGEYATGNSFQWMQLHGIKTQFTEIHVAYPYERFVAATGKYGPYSGEQQKGVTVTELSFVTYNNITGKTVTYGPYGGHETSGQTSFLTADKSELAGLYGFTSDYMRGIGFVLDSS